MGTERFCQQFGIAPDALQTDRETNIRCPACDDEKEKTGHLGLRLADDGRLLLKCHHGCDTADVLAARYCTKTDLFPRKAPDAKREVGSVEEYTDEAGDYLFETVRYFPKDFRQRVRDMSAKGGYRWNLKGVRRVLFQLQPLVAAIVRSVAEVLVLEGEKDVRSAMRLGYVATCNPMGAGKWRDEYSKMFRGYTGLVVVIADKDPDRDERGTLHRKGQQHAAKVSRSLASVGVRIAVLELPDRGDREVKDLSDWTDAGGTRAELDVLIAAAVDGQVYAQEIEGWLQEQTSAKIAGTSLSGAGQPPGGDKRIDFTLPFDLDEATTGLLDAVVKKNSPPTLFRYGESIAETLSKNGSIGLRPLVRRDQVREALGRRVKFCDVHTKDGKEVLVPKASCPNSLADNVLARPSNLVPLPLIDAILRVPTFAPSGEPLFQSGYHPAEKTLVDLVGLQVPSVPMAPIRSDVDAAVTLFDELIHDLPFEHQADRATWYAALITLFARQLFQGPAPFFLFEASTPGTGKGLAASLLWIVAWGEGRQPEQLNLCREEGENQKSIMAVLTTAPSIVLLDNLPDGGRLASPRFASLLTSHEHGGRILGETRSASFPNRALWLGTGNNIRLSNELATRTVSCRLRTTCERPRERTGFLHPLPKWAIAERPRLVAAVLTLIRSWIVAGKPPGHAVMGSFESWAATVSGVLEHIGITGLLADRNALLNRSDDDSATWRPFVQAWSEKYGTKPVAVGELAKLATDFDLLGGMLHGETEKAKSSALGKLLRKYQDRIFAGWRIHAVTRGAGNRSTCSLEQVEGTSGERSGGPSAPQSGTEGGSGERREGRERFLYPPAREEKYETMTINRLAEGSAPRPFPCRPK
jgi:hypothetical protein